MDRPATLKVADWLVIVAATLVLFISCCSLAVWFTWDDINTNFRRNQPVIHATLSQRLNNLDAALVSLVGQIHSSTTAPERITSFANSIVQQFSYLQTVIIVKQVSDATRPGYEDTKRQSGNIQFKIGRASCRERV